MITIKPSPTADSRTCDRSKVTPEQLRASSYQHIGEVGDGLLFFSYLLTKAACEHDADKLLDIDGFYANFKEGFREGHDDWFERHKRLNRHHLDYPEGVPEDVNLIDVLEHIADCVMAGMGRTGSVYPLVLSDSLLQRAFQNTVTLLKKEVVVDLKLSEEKSDNSEKGA